MSINNIKRYRYKESLPVAKLPFFEVGAIHLDVSCVAHQSHQSEHFKIYWIEEGRGEYQIDFQSFRVDGAALFFLSPGQVLSVELEAVKQGYEVSFDRDFYCVETHGKEIACNGVLFNNVHRATVIPLQPEDVGSFRMMFENMITELENPGPAHRAMLETFLRMLLIQALRKLDEQQLSENGAAEETNRLAADFIALVEKYFKQKHGVAEYAEMLAVSPKSLAKRLNELGYKTPKEVIRDRIVLQAKRELRYADKPVKEIAFDLGFDDPAYFSRLFSKAEGQSPQAYRDFYLS